MNKKEAIKLLDQIFDEHMLSKRDVGIDGQRYISMLQRFLKNQIESNDASKDAVKGMRTVPSRGQKYYFVYFDEGNYEVRSLPWYNHNCDKNIYLTFNCFLSREKADLECRKRNAWLKLRNLEEKWAEEHGWPDWNDGESFKMYVYKCNYSNSVQFDMTTTDCENNCYFSLNGNYNHCQEFIIYGMGNDLNDLFIEVRGN